MTADFSCFAKARHELMTLSDADRKAFVTYNALLERLARGYSLALCRLHSIDCCETTDAAADVEFLKKISANLRCGSSDAETLDKARRAGVLRELMYQLCDRWMRRSWEITMQVVIETPTKVSLVLKRLFYILDRSITMLRQDRSRRARLGWKLPNASSHQPELASRTGNLYNDTKEHVELSAKFRHVVDEYCDQLGEEEQQNFDKSCMRKGFNVADISL